MVDPTRRRRRWLAGLGALSVLVGGVSGWWLRPQEGGPDAASSCARAPVTAQPSLTVSPAGGGLHLLESGFTQTDGGAKVSVGGVVENTSTMVAVDAWVRFSVLDEAGASAQRAETESRIFAIPVVLPGERVGVGAWISVRPTAKENGHFVTVGSIGVELSAAQWFGPTDPGADFAAVPTEHEGMLRSPYARSADLQFSMDSPYCYPVTARGVATVFRDQSGAIVGGSFDAFLEQSCTPGRSRHLVVAFFEVPLTVDDTRTRDYPYCDPTRHGPAPTYASGAPLNP